LNNLLELQKRLGYTFKDISLLRDALRHSSFVNEKHLDKLSSNERLEFLGDSILGFTAAEYLFNMKPMQPEGQMTRTRANLVCEKSLHSAAVRLGIGDYIEMGLGEEKTGGRSRPSLLSDALEAIFAAVYLDGGMDAARGVITEQVLTQKPHLRSISADSKTALQEYVQRSPGQSVIYEIIDETGPAHERLYTAQATALGQMARGEGKSKKLAEMAAAESLLAAFGEL